MWHDCVCSYNIIMCVLYTYVLYLGSGVESLNSTAVGPNSSNSFSWICLCSLSSMVSKRGSSSLLLSSSFLNLSSCSLKVKFYARRLVGMHACMEVNATNTITHWFITPVSCYHFLLRLAIFSLSSRSRASLIWLLLSPIMKFLNSFQPLYRSLNITACKTSRHSWYADLSALDVWNYKHHKCLVCICKSCVLCCEFIQSCVDHTCDSLKRYGPAGFLATCSARDNGMSIWSWGGTVELKKQSIMAVTLLSSIESSVCAWNIPYTCTRKLGYKSSHTRSLYLPCISVLHTKTWSLLLRI